MMDKLAHLFAGGFIAAAVLPINSWLALAAVFVAAVAKETHDASADWYDAAATVLGGVLMLGWLAWI